jgi:hypothetical protein
VSGFQLAFWIAAGIAAAGVIVAVFGMPGARRSEVTNTQAAVVVEM